MSDFKELAFKATVVDEFREDNLFAINKNGVYYETENGIKKFSSEQKALEYILKTLVLNKKYNFVDVFYNPNYEQQEEDGLKYSNYIMVISRKAVAVKNQLFSYLTAPFDTSGDLFLEEDFEEEKPHSLDDEKNLNNIQGLGLKIVMQDKKEEVYDIRDNFIYKVIDKDVTCDWLFKHIQEQVKKVRYTPDIVLIDVTGSELKSTFRDNLVVDDALDIYREFLGGTLKTEEDLDKEEIDKDNEKHKNMPNDSEYI